MSIKAIGIAIKLTMEGLSQVAHFQTWVFVMVAISCIIVQLNYLNKVSVLLFCSNRFGIITMEFVDVKYRTFLLGNRLV